METYLALTAIGEHQKDIVYKFIALISKSGCAVRTSRINVMGSEFTAAMLLGGPWSAVAKLEASLPKFKQKHHLDIHYKRAEFANEAEPLIPYVVSVLSVSRADLLHHVSEFFTDQKILIAEINSNSFFANGTHVPMISLNMTVHVRTDICIGELREQFILFCEDYNLDGALEPEKS